MSPRLLLPSGIYTFDELRQQEARQVGAPQAGLLPQEGREQQHGRLQALLLELPAAISSQDGRKCLLRRRKDSKTDRRNAQGQARTSAPADERWPNLGLLKTEVIRNERRPSITGSSGTRAQGLANPTPEEYLVEESGSMVLMALEVTACLGCDASPLDWRSVIISYLVSLAIRHFSA